MQTSATTGTGAAPASALQVGQRHFEAAMRRVAPSVSRKDQRVYDQLRRSLRSTRGHLDASVGVARRLMFTRSHVHAHDVYVKLTIALFMQPLEITAEPGAGTVEHRVDTDETLAVNGPSPGHDCGAAKINVPDVPVKSVAY